jgi:hypothetical protein
MPTAGFEHAIPASKRPQYALDRAATEIGAFFDLQIIEYF